MTQAGLEVALLNRIWSPLQSLRGGRGKDFSLIIFPKSRFNSVLWFPQKTGSTYMVAWVKLCSCSICYVYCTV